MSPESAGARAWRRFRHAPASPRNLAAARIIVAVHATWILLSRDLPGVSGVDGSLWAAVPESRQWRYLLFHGHPDLELGLQAAAIAALVAVALGVAARFAALAAALLLYHLAPLETVIWTSSPYERGFEVSVLALVILAVSRCADAWRVGPARSPAPAASAEYRWPLRLIQVLVAQIYLFSGWSKLIRVGPEWITADNMRRWLLVFQQQDQIAVFTALGTWIADRPALCMMAGVGALGADFGIAVGLFVPALRRWCIVAAGAFHAGILFAMNIAFLNAPQLLIFIDWDGLAARLAGRGPMRGRARPAEAAAAGPAR